MQSPFKVSSRRDMLGERICFLLPRGEVKSFAVSIPDRWPSNTNFFAYFRNLFFGARFSKIIAA